MTISTQIEDEHKENVKSSENEIKFQFHIETIDGFLPDARELFKKDWEETTSDGIEFNIDEEEYKNLEKLGRLAIFTVRYVGKLAGYIAFVASESLHHKKTIANCSGMYIAKEYRGMTGLYLLDYAIKGLKSFKIDKVRISSSPKNDISRLLERYGFKPEETIHGLML